MLRTVRGVQEGNFVPYLSVTSGVLLAAASIGVLIYFIHHIATSIQTESLVASVGAELLRAWPQREELDENQVQRLRGAFSLGVRRTPTQDVRYGARQLTEIAARALSPGINDPFTAMGCTDWLADALAEMARSEVPSGVQRGAEDR